MNQDTCFAELLPGGVMIAAVCDGMGGLAAGNVASDLAKTIIYESMKFMISDSVSLSPDRCRDIIVEALIMANKKIYAMSEKNSEYHGMGTTAVAAIVSHGTLVIGHIGDSRAYIFSDDELTQITKDHSFVQLLVDAGKITSEQAQTHPQKNIITRSLGADQDVVSDVTAVPFTSGNTLLLCSDGLTNYVSDENISKILSSEKACDPEQTVKTLINAANHNGGGDNITVVLVCAE